MLARPPGRQQPPLAGSAHLDFRRIVEVLREIHHGGYVSMEILPWPDPDTAARCSIESLRRYIPGPGGGQTAQV